MKPRSGFRVVEGQYTDRAAYRFYIIRNTCRVFVVHDGGAA